MSDDPACAESPQRARGARVRPYALTGGRTHPDQHLLRETLVSVPDYDPKLSESLLPESRAVYERAREEVSVAELCAGLSLPLGVLRILIGDLVTAGAVTMRPVAAADVYDHALLERILDGITNMPS